MSLYLPTFPEVLNVARGHGANSCAPDLWNGLVGLWPLAAGGGSTAYDLSGYGNHGTLTNMDPATDWVVGEKGYALDFDGSDDYVQCDLPAGMESTTSVSIASWVYLYSASDDGAFIKVDRAGSRGWGIGVGNGSWGTSGNHLIVLFEGVAWKDTGVNIGTGWHLVAATIGGGLLKQYIDGREVYSASSAGMRAPVSYFHIGGYDAGSGRLRFPIHQNSLTGAWASTLAPSQIYQLYSDPYAMFRLRRKVYPAAVAAASDVLWYYNAQQVAACG